MASVSDVVSGFTTLVGGSAVEASMDGRERLKLVALYLAVLSGFGEGDRNASGGVAEICRQLAGVGLRPDDGGGSAADGVACDGGSGHFPGFAAGNQVDVADDRDGSVVRPNVVGATSAFVGGTMPRGPNYERNKIARMRKKVQREERRMAEAEARGRHEAETRMRGAGSRTEGRSEDEQRLHSLKVKRQIVQEERKLKRLESPEQILEDAMRQVALAERCAKLKNNSKVAGWAATIYTAHSESIARSAPSSVPSFGSSGSSVKSAGARKAAAGADGTVASLYSIAAMPLSGVEQAAVDTGVLTHSKLVEARAKAGRALDRGDFHRPGAPRLSDYQFEAIEDAYRSKHAVDYGYWN